MVPQVLIVDSDDSAAQVTRAIVARAVPDATVSVESALQRTWLNGEHYWPDVLIIDPSPHSPDGVQLIQRIKQESPNACVIVIASVPTPALRRQMESLGVDAYLEKPTLLPQRLQELQAVLQRSVRSLNPALSSDSPGA